MKNGFMKNNILDFDTVSYFKLNAGGGRNVYDND